MEVIFMRKRFNKKNFYKKKFNKNTFATTPEELRELQTIREGTMVKLNFQKLSSHPDWNRLTEDFRKFVKDNVDQVFTVRYDRGVIPSEHPLYVTLAEDPRPDCAKWLFHVEDLIPIETEN